MQYRRIERIVTHSSHRGPSGLPDYLCKWCGLPYSDATWEDGGLIDRFYADNIAAYQRRVDSAQLPSKSTKVCRGPTSRNKDQVAHLHIHIIYCCICRCCAIDQSSSSSRSSRLISDLRAPTRLHCNSVTTSSRASTGLRTPGAETTLLSWPMKWASV